MARSSKLEPVYSTSENLTRLRDLLERAIKIIETELEREAAPTKTVPKGWSGL